MNLKHKLFAGLLSLLVANASSAAIWSNNEVHFQHGELTNAFTEEDATTNIITLQHASGWEYGSNFFFVDYSSANGGDQFYGEWYSTLSANSILSTEFTGPIKDIGLVIGVNAAPEVDELKYLPGIQIDWDISGFAFFKTLLTGYIDDGNATTVGIEDDDSWMLDVAWKYPFSIGKADFSIEGHAEYIAERDFSADFGNGKQEAWILAQPQIRWDAGKSMFGKAGKFHLGVELQFWNNKLGTTTDENAVQFLAVWAL